MAVGARSEGAPSHAALLRLFFFRAEDGRECMCVCAGPALTDGLVEDGWGPDIKKCALIHKSTNMCELPIFFFSIPLPNQTRKSLQRTGACAIQWCWPNSSKPLRTPCNNCLPGSAIVTANDPLQLPSPPTHTPAGAAPP